MMSHQKGGEFVDKP